MSKYYVPEYLRMRIGELYEEGHGAKRIAAILGLHPTYVGWMLQRYRASGKQGLMLKSRTHISFEGKVEVVSDIMKNSLSYKAAALKYDLSPSIVGRWMHIVEEYGLEGLRRKKILPMSIRKVNKHTEADFKRLEKELEDARLEIALLKKVQSLTQEKIIQREAPGRWQSKS